MSGLGNIRIGDVLDGRYRTLDYVHGGSFGEVWKALDLKTRQVVAVKCILKRSAVDGVDVEGAAWDDEERQVHETLGSHKNIVNLLYHFETEYHQFLVLEYCQRGDLYEAIRAGKGPVDTEDVRQLMLELIDAVDYSHSMGIYHRDIKPENIFLTEDGNLKLGDFGLATREVVSYEPGVGSDRYMAPEQCETESDGYSPAQADIWAVGIVLLNVLFHKNPFNTPTLADRYFSDFCTDHMSLFDLFETMSEDTFEVLKQCLTLDPAKRSLRGARKALQRVVAFTTIDADEDAFLVGSPKAHATAGREPLGTPCVLSPAIDEGTFWTQSLTPPQPIGPSKLGASHAIGSYSEDLFPQSMESRDWCSADTVQSHSLASTMDSQISMPKNALNITFPDKFRARFEKVSPMAGSLPINISKPQQIPSMSTLFGRQEGAAKSWSDMYDEELEEQEREQSQEPEIHEDYARTNSVGSSSGDETTKVDGLRHHESMFGEQKSITVDATAVGNKEDIDDLFSFEPPSPKHNSPLSQQQWLRYTPPAKKQLDKWEMLGARRRGEEPRDKQNTDISSGTTLEFTRPRRQREFGNTQHNNYTFGTGHIEQHSNYSTYHSNTFNRNQNYRSGGHGRDRDGHGASPWTRRFHDSSKGFHREGGRGDCRDLSN